MAHDTPLKFSEYHPFKQLLNEKGYVLDFSSDDFGRFTEEIVGIDLLQEYNQSKGKSLVSFLHEAPRTQSIELLRALMSEWEKVRRPFATEKQKDLAKECYEHLNSLISDRAGKGIHDRLVENGFTSDYLDEQSKLLWEKVSTNPAASIGIAKDLIESCCKTILNEREVDYSNTDGLPKLVDQVQLALKINPRSITEEVPESETIKALLGGLARIAKNLAELRNSYGIGHGREKDFKGLSERHARLATGSALTLVEYLWSTHLERSHNSNR